MAGDQIDDGLHGPDAVIDKDMWIDRGDDNTTPVLILSGLLHLITVRSSAQKPSEFLQS